MNAPLALAVVLLTSVVCGIALWPRPAFAAAGPARAPVQTVDQAALPAGTEADLARAALASMGAPARSRAIVAPAVDASVMVARRAPPEAVVVGGGIALAELDELPRQLLVRLLQHAAATMTGDRAASELARLDARLRDGVTFAWAGPLGATTPFYVRLHGREFVVEWVARDGERMRGAWRDFALDAGTDYLVETVFGAAPR